jgi:hypothetical protein
MLFLVVASGYWLLVSSSWLPVSGCWLVLHYARSIFLFHFLLFTFDTSFDNSYHRPLCHSLACLPVGRYVL